MAASSKHIQHILILPQDSKRQEVDAPLQTLTQEIHVSGLLSGCFTTIGKGPALRQAGFAERSLREGGYRLKQEDAAAVHVLKTSLNLSPVAIGKRLWAMLHSLDSKHDYRSGSTASMTVYDGQQHLITATVGDSVAFAAIYNKAGECIKVVRLNSELHDWKNPHEVQRLQALLATKKVTKYPLSGRRVNELLVSRAIGDKIAFEYIEDGPHQGNYRYAAQPELQTIFAAHAKMDVTTLDTLIAQSHIDKTDIDCIKIITASDGLTEHCDSPAEGVLPEHYNARVKAIEEDAVQAWLNHPRCRAAVSQGPSALAQALGEASENLGTGKTKRNAHDNKTIIVSHIPIAGVATVPAFAQAVFDGHGGPEVSDFLARNFNNELHTFLAMPEAAFSLDPHNPDQLRLAPYYRHDNPSHTAAAVTECPTVLTTAASASTVTARLVVATSEEEKRERLTHLTCFLSRAKAYHRRTPTAGITADDIDWAGMQMSIALGKFAPEHLSNQNEALWAGLCCKVATYHRFFAGSDNQKYTKSLNDTIAKLRDQFQMYPSKALPDFESFFTNTLKSQPGMPQDLDGKSFTVTSIDDDIEVFSWNNTDDDVSLRTCSDNTDDDLSSADDEFSLTDDELSSEMPDSSLSSVTPSQSSAPPSGVAEGQTPSPGFLGAYPFVPPPLLTTEHAAVAGFGMPPMSLPPTAPYAPVSGPGLSPFSSPLAAASPSYLTPPAMGSGLSPVPGLPYVGAFPNRPLAAAFPYGAPPLVSATTSPYTPSLGTGPGLGFFAQTSQAPFPGASAFMPSAAYPTLPSVGANAYPSYPGLPRQTPHSLPSTVPGSFLPLPSVGANPHLGSLGQLPAAFPGFGLYGAAPSASATASPYPIPLGTGSGAGFFGQMSQAPFAGASPSVPSTFVPGMDICKP